MALQLPPPPLSTQSMADLLCTIILFCSGTGTDGKPFWAYMCIKPSMADSFKEARDRGEFKLEDYGTILEIGEGLEAPQDVRQRMETQYGVNHHYEEELLEYIEAMTKEA
jgi:hypothetical protein